MHYLKICFLIVCIAGIVSGCKKDTAVNHCQDLKNALTIDAKDDIKSLINAYINRMPSQDYTAQNINELAFYLSKECSISTVVFCFDCITTLPSMSEIQITVTSTQPNTSKVIDISYTAANKMSCVNVHD